MQTLLSSLGIVAIVAIVTILAIKTMETVWFFQAFRKEVDEALKRIHESIHSRKP
jgi:hypothetical protein